AGDRWARRVNEPPWVLAPRRRRIVDPDAWRGLHDGGAVAGRRLLEAQRGCRVAQIAPRVRAVDPEGDGHEARAAREAGCGQSAQAGKGLGPCGPAGAGPGEPSVGPELG